MFEYATMRFTTVIGLTDAKPAPDGAYLSEDVEAHTYRDLIGCGYRWIRTDGDFAIFERPIPVEGKP